MRVHWGYHRWNSFSLALSKPLLKPSPYLVQIVCFNSLSPLSVGSLHTVLVLTNLRCHSPREVPWLALWAWNRFSSSVHETLLKANWTSNLSTFAVWKLLPGPDLEDHGGMREEQMRTALEKYKNLSHCVVESECLYCLCTNALQNLKSSSTVVSSKALTRQAIQI